MACEGMETNRAHAVSQKSSSVLKSLPPLRGSPPRLPRSSPWRAVAALTLTAAGLTAGFLIRGAHLRAVATVRACQTAVVTHGTVSGLLRARGRLLPGSTVRVGSGQPGRVVAVAAKPGDSVKAGQILARLEAVEQRTAVSGAEAQLTSAELLGLRAERQLDETIGSLRAQGQLPQDLSPDDLLEGAAGEAQLELLHATSQIARQRASLGLARSLLAARTIRAPMAGVVLSRTIEAGESIPASPPAPPLFVIGSDPSELKMEVEIDEEYASGIQPGTVTFTTPGHGHQEFSAFVRQIVPVEGAVRSPGRYTVVLAVPNREGTLAPGASTTVDLPAHTSLDALQVPAIAVRSASFGAGEPAGFEGKLLWLSNDQGQPTARAVDVGVTETDVVEVRAPGLGAGQVVVTDREPASCRVPAPTSPFGSGEP